jgi:hypothetical protein
MELLAKRVNYLAFAGTQQSIEELLSSMQHVLLIQEVVKTQSNSIFREHISGRSNLTDKIQNIV